MDARVGQNAPQVIYAKDYKPPEYLIEKVSLDFDLHDTASKITSRMKIYRNGDHDHPLIMVGEDVDLLSLRLNGEGVDPESYHILDGALTLKNVPHAFELEVITRVNAAENTELSGLYLSGGNFCTQCEAEGFRRITYFLDRPDVMAKYETTVRADKDRFPVLLSNGNMVDSGDEENGRHWARWVDPHPKPSYLFALVAGTLKPLSDNFITRSGRDVTLNIYVAEADLPKCDHAMEALKKAMRWEEEIYGREYDLDVYNIVAVSDFNMGAMENKGLNVFNTRYVLASPDTATDADFDHVEGVIAHEYFHNWTGNRVTCRDWFQLSLKEGLTVFRDQEFSADQGSRAVKRIEDVRVLRAVQFPEDAGPLAHPVRPDSYIEINNFYTPTVYNKGAEVIRMIHALLGAETFRKGMDLYFERHDGQAVTCVDFVTAMADASGLDFTQFKLWYAQAGTPQVKASSVYNSDEETLTLTLSQHLKDSPGQTNKKPMVIPVKTALIAEDGGAVKTRCDGVDEVEHILLLDAVEKSFVFEGVEEKVVPSLLRGFSAPIALDAGLSISELAFLARYDDDPFNRWEAFQTLASHCALEQIARYQKGNRVETDGRLVKAVEMTLSDQNLDPAFVAEAIAFPSEGVLADKMNVVDVDAVHAVRKAFRKDVAAALYPQFEAVYHANCGFQSMGQEDKARRKLKNAALAYLMAGREDGAVPMAFQQFEHATNMTDELAALALLSNTNADERQIALDKFYEKWRREALVLDKWFAIQAQSSRPDTLDSVKTLINHPDFTRQNPNRLRALVAGFAHANQLRFHAADGAGYRLLADEVLATDRLNPQTAARLLGPLGRWRRMDEGRAALMRGELQRIINTEGVSKDVFEIASKSLGQ